MGTQTNAGGVTKTGKVESTSLRDARSRKTRSIRYGKGRGISRETKGKGDHALRSRKGFECDFREEKLGPSNTSMDDFLGNAFAEAVFSFLKKRKLEWSRKGS